MAKIKPFSALRYNEEKFPLPPVAPPYDIISEKQRQEFAANDAHMINLDKPGSDQDSERYEKAARRMQSWITEKILIHDDTPSMYIYAQRFHHPETGVCIERTGFFAAVKLEDHYEESIFPHERTLSAPKEDRLNLMRATQSNLSPVFGLYDDPENEADKIFAAVKEATPLYNVYTDADGTEHRIWRIAEKADLDALTDILSGKNIIIADGHHRYATALNYRNEMRIAEGTGEGCHAPYEYVLMDLINFNDAGLVILPTHRLLSLSVDTDDLLAKLHDYFEVKESSADMIEKVLAEKSGSDRCLGLYFGKEAKNYLLYLKNPAVLDGVVPESPSTEWRELEVNLLYYVILKEIITISDEDFQVKLTYTHSCSETFELVDNGEPNCAFLLPSCTKDELEKVTLAHEVMPQKSTYFFPKIFSGFVIFDHGV